MPATRTPDNRAVSALLLGALPYRVQAAALGDLDRAAVRLLERLAAEDCREARPVALLATSTRASSCWASAFASWPATSTTSPSPGLMETRQGARSERIPRRL